MVFVYEMKCILVHVVGVVIDRDYELYGFLEYACYKGETIVIKERAKINAPKKKPHESPFIP